MAALHLFSVAGIPVRASLGFFLLLAWFGYMHRGAGGQGVILVLVAVVLTLLIHELGHAFVARRLRLEPQVILHGWGGLCLHHRAPTRGGEALIAAAGPLAQLGVAGAVHLSLGDLPPTEAGGFFVGVFVLYSVAWGVLNLVPIFPLDGGHLLRLAMLRLVKPEARAERIVYLTGIALSGAAVVVGLFVIGSPMLAVLGVLWGLENQRLLRGGDAAGPAAAPARDATADALLAEATAAFQAADFHEARRLAFQARGTRNLAQDQLDLALRIVTVASAEVCDWDEVLDWARLAPRTPDVFMATLLAKAGKGHGAAARLALQEADAPALPPAWRDRVEAAIRASGA
jgi:stage IV sporulation protein FB